MSYVYQNIIIGNSLKNNTTNTAHIVTVNKGDLISDTGSGTITIPVGTTGQVLNVNSTASTGLAWTTLTAASVGLPISNFTASVAPTNTDGSNEGYSVGSEWYYGGNEYVLTNATPGSANWELIAFNDNTLTFTNKSFGSNVNMNGYLINNLGTPLVGTDAANKSYVDNSVYNLDVKAAVDTATVGPLNLSNNGLSSITYNSTGGTAGTGQFTGSLNVSGQFTVDGITYSASNNGTRILVKNQASADQNGIYTFTISGSNITLNRSSDFNSSTNVVQDSFTFVGEGTTNASSGWVLTTEPPITVGGSNGSQLTWTQFSGAGEITAGTGLAKNGNVLSVSNIPLGTAGIVTGVLPVQYGGTGTNTFGSSNVLVAVNTSGNLTTTTLVPGTVVTMAGTQILTNKTLTLPIITDANGNTILNFNTATNAVNYIHMIDAASGAAPTITAVNSSSTGNVNLALAAQNSGNVTISGISYPNADGLAGQVLSTNGSGVLSFANVTTDILASVTTSNNTATTLMTYALTAQPAAYYFNTQIVARQNSSPYYVGTFTVRSTVYNISAASTPIKDQADDYVYASNATTWSVTPSISGSNYVLTVQDTAGANSILWSAKLSFISV